jgi:hypothetical protein
MTASPRARASRANGANAGSSANPRTNASASSRRALMTALCARVTWRWPIAPANQAASSGTRSEAPPENRSANALPTSRGDTVPSKSQSQATIGMCAAFSAARPPWPAA